MSLMSLTAWRISMVKCKKKKNPTNPGRIWGGLLEFRDGAVWPRRPERQEYMGENTSAHLEWTQSTAQLCLVHKAGEKSHLQVFKEHCLDPHRALSIAYCSAVRAKDTSFMDQLVAFPQEFSFRSRWGLVLNQVLCWPSHGLKTDLKECNCFQVTYPAGQVEGGGCCWSIYRNTKFSWT